MDPKLEPSALSSLSVTNASLNPGFSPTTLMYTANVSLQVTSVQVTAVAGPGATIQINGTQVASGSPSAAISVGATPTMISVLVQAANGSSKNYGVVVMQVASDYLKATNPGAADFFGSALSLSGDTLAVGAVWESSSATGINGDQSDNGTMSSGAVYIFQRTGTTWAQQAYLKASNTGVGDRFGFSVSLSGDTLAVGAVFEASASTGVNGVQSDNSASQSGAVYVFQRTGTTWAQQAYVKASNTEESDTFGTSVSLSGDTLAVGANGESSAATGLNKDQTDNSAPQSGAVYVFQRTGTTWAQQAYVKASNTEAGDNFGTNVSLSGNTLAVAATSEAGSAKGVNGNANDNSAPQSGAVYVFQRTGTTWAQQAYVKASNTDVGDRFGAGISLSGDTLAVGASGESSSGTGVNGNQSDNNSLGSGAVYVFQRTGTTWAQQAYVKASNTEAGDFFGGSVSLSGDTLAVAAHLESSSSTGLNGNQSNNGALNSGAVYVFQRTGTTWTQRTYYKASNTEAGDFFGSCVSLSGTTLAVGAQLESSSATGVNGNQSDNSIRSSGAVYVFR